VEVEVEDAEGVGEEDNVGVSTKRHNRIQFLNLKVTIFIFNCYIVIIL
jgi:hypothetical protein